MLVNLNPEIHIKKPVWLIIEAGLYLKYYSKISTVVDRFLLWSSITTTGVTHAHRNPIVVLPNYQTVNDNFPSCFSLEVNKTQHNIFRTD